jgi:hypothetical protein
MVDHVLVGSWGPFNNLGDLQTHYFRVPFEGTPRIVATAYLADVSIGDSPGPEGQPGQAGIALASFKRFEFLNDAGMVQEQEVTEVTAFLDIRRCVSITIALDLAIGTALGGWTFYTLS